MDATGNHFLEPSKPNSERQILHCFSYTWNLDLQLFMPICVYLCMLVCRP